MEGHETVNGCRVLEKFGGGEETPRFVRVGSLGIEINVFQVDGEWPVGRKWLIPGAWSPLHVFYLLVSCGTGWRGRKHA